MRQFILLICIFITLDIFAAISPQYSEASERGYQIDGDSVVFPDKTKCLLTDFNNGECGQKWMTDDYCVPEGAYVWNEDKCCEGLKAYLPEGMDGQAKCVKIEATEKQSATNDDDNWFTSLMDNSLFWIGILLPFVLLIYVAFSIKKKINKDKHQKE